MSSNSTSNPSARGHPAGRVTHWLAHGGKPTPAKATAAIGMLAFAVMNITTIVSLRGMPSQAEYGLHSIFYYCFAALVFLIPVSLVAAELASAYPKQGGVFRWVGEAFGARWGFAAIYYQWQAIVIWFPTVLIFAATALAYVWSPPSFSESLSHNKLYTIAVLLTVYWFVTLFSFRGVESSARLSTAGGLLGTIIPGAILIILGGVYVMAGHPIALSLQGGVMPKFSGFHDLVLAAGVFLYFAGMEMQAVHVTNLNNPARNYPLSVAIAAVGVIVIFVLGTLAVAVVVPKASIDLNQSLLVAYRALWSAFGLPWLGNVVAAMLAFGVLGQVSAIVAGPSTGLLAVGKAGYLPPWLQRTNQHGVPVAILLLQGGLVTLLCLAFIVLPSVQAAYQILSQLATIVYLVMYVIMYAAAIKLRYSQPETKRPFRIPGGNVGMWFVGLVGLAGALLALFISFIPPTQIGTGSPWVYVGTLLIGSAVFVAMPFAFYAFHKPDWKAGDSDFEPFTKSAASGAPASRPSRETDRSAPATNVPAEKSVHPRQSAAP